MSGRLFSRSLIVIGQDSQGISTTFSAIQLDPHQLNGRFFLAFHDGARNEQVVITDRLKTAPKQAIMVGPAACPSTRHEN